MFDLNDLKNIKSLVDTVFAQGHVKTPDEAKVLLLIEAKCMLALKELEEVPHGDNLPRSD